MTKFTVISFITLTAIKKNNMHMHNQRQAYWLLNKRKKTKITNLTTMTDKNDQQIEPEQKSLDCGTNAQVCMRWCYIAQP